MKKTLFWIAILIAFIFFSLYGQDTQHHLQKGMFTVSDSGLITAHGGVSTDQVTARNATGLKLFEDGGIGIFIEDGGKVGIETTAPSSRLTVGNPHATAGANNDLTVVYKIGAYTPEGLGVSIGHVAGDYGSIYAYDYAAWTAKDLRINEFGGNVDIATATGALIVPRMTIAQRNALTAVNGMIIYNTTTAAFNFYEDGAWTTK